MITIDKAILHILDFSSGIKVFSEKELDIQSKSVISYLTKHIGKSFNNLNMKSGSFQTNSKFKEQMLHYINNDLDFINFSIYIADLFHTCISKSDKLDSTDLIICDFDIDGQHQIGILVCINKTGFTHQVVNNNNKVYNDIINHCAILPNTSQKLDEYAFIDIKSKSIKFSDKKRNIDGKGIFIISDFILECKSSISPKDAVKLVNSITREVAESHGQSSVFAVSKAKNFIIENIEQSDCLEPIELGKEVFSSSAEMQEEFIKEVRNAGIPETVKIDKAFAVKAGRNHKIKTDTGIEISIPVEYFNNKDLIEFVNNSDGTLSIELKKIAKIINR